MKKSSYIISKKMDEKNVLVSNLISGAVVSLSPNEFVAFEKILANPSSGEAVDSNMYNEMIEMGFLIEDEANELSMAKRNYWVDKMDNSYLNLTIVPTYNCNFGCNYCYQKGCSTQIMSQEDGENIYRFIDSRIKQIKALSVNWFGGEPLLVLDLIYKLNERIINLCLENEVQYTSSISTNAYTLDSDAIEKLKTMKINRLYTTLAGTEEYHNSLRYTKDNKPTFTQVMNNIKLAQKHFSITINIVISKTNNDNVKELLDYLKLNNMVDNIFIVFNRIESSENNPCDDICLSKSQYSKDVMEYYKYAKAIGLRACNTTKFNTNCLYCSADHENSYSIDPKGAVYKCTDVIDESTRIGYISNEGDLVLDKFYNELLKDPFNDEKCKECSILPYCNGGCSNKRSANKDFCPNEVENIEDYLELFYCIMN